MRNPSLIALALAGLAFIASGNADAQARRITGTPQAPRQAPPPGVATFGTPSPSGLASPVPAGLTPPTAPSLTPPGSPNLSAPGAAPGSMVLDGAVVPYVVGGGGGGVVAGQAAGYGGATNVMGGAGFARGPLTAVDIARAFLDADTNRDGELSRNEAQRVSIANLAFDDLDRNRDGVLSRFEYDDAFR